MCTRRYAKYTSCGSVDPHNSPERPVIRNKGTETDPKPHGQEVMGSGDSLRFSDPTSISLFIVFHGLKGWMTGRWGGEGGGDCWQRNKEKREQREEAAGESQWGGCPL